MSVRNELSLWTEVWLYCISSWWSLQKCWWTRQTENGIYDIQHFTSNYPIYRHKIKNLLLLLLLLLYIYIYIYTHTHSLPVDNMIYQTCWRIKAVAICNFSVLWWVTTCTMELIVITLATHLWFYALHTFLQYTEIHLLIPSKCSKSDSLPWHPHMKVKCLLLPCSFNANPSTSIPALHEKHIWLYSVENWTKVLILWCQDIHAQSCKALLG